MDLIIVEIRVCFHNMQAYAHLLSLRNGSRSHWTVASTLLFVVVDVT
jgi:hypothetical protein